MYNFKAENNSLPNTKDDFYVKLDNNIDKNEEGVNNSNKSGIY